MDEGRLALLLPDMGGGGAERVALTLINGFLNRGYQVDLILLQSRGELLSLVPDQARVIDLHVDRIRRSIRPLTHYLNSECPVGLLALMWPMPIVAVISKFLAGSRTRVVASDHGMLTQHYQGRPSKMVSLWLTTRLFYPLADERVAASAGIVHDLAAISGLPENQFQVVANPIDMPSSIIHCGSEVESLWHGEGAKILGVGRLKPEKDFELLLRAFARLVEHRDASLVILGEGPLRTKLEDLAVRLGIADRVAMPGFRVDTSPFYATADLFVLSSTSEGFGNVLVEAMAAGLPVVSTNCPGPCEVLDHGRYGCLVPAGDVEALTAAMKAALTKPGNVGEQKARAAQFSPERAIRRYCKLLTGETA